MADIVYVQDTKIVARLPLESVVQLTGTIQLRPPGQTNKVVQSVLPAIHRLLFVSFLCGLDILVAVQTACYQPCRLPFGGIVLKGPKIGDFGPKFWPFDLEYLENGMSQHSIWIRA